MYKFDQQTIKITENEKNISDYQVLFKSRNKKNFWRTRFLF